MGIFRSDSNSKPVAWRFARGWLLASLVLAVNSVAAQEAVQEIDLVNLPTTRHLAAALSDPESREDTLMTMAVVAHLRQFGRSPVAGQFDALVARFRDERGWLDRLAQRYTDMNMRASVLDPAAWHLALELDQQSLLPGSLVSPLGPETDRLLAQLFDRSDERLAATILPEVISRLALNATVVWDQVLGEAAVNEPFSLLLQVLDADWFDPWVAAEPPAPIANPGEMTVIEKGVLLFQDLSQTALQPGPPDALTLKRLRFGLLSALPQLAPGEAEDARFLLQLADAVDALYRQDYLGVTETLLWVASHFLLSEGATARVIEVDSRGFRVRHAIVLAQLPDEASPDDSDEPAPWPPAPYSSPVPRVLSEWLPALSNVFANDFSSVDPRINSSLASVFDTMQYFQTDGTDSERLSSLRRGVANAVAQMVLLIPDMNYYFDQPVREPIAEEIDVCISILAASRGETGLPVSREQFDGCLQGLGEKAATMLSSAELSGDPDGPFGIEHLRRELLLTPWQRINYVIGYLDERYPASCANPAQPIPNPLEWASLVTMVSWLAQQSPVYFQAPENEALVASLQQQGRDMMASLLQRVDCISGTGTGINDPVQRGLSDYREALGELVNALREAELAFRAENLKPGADVVLHGDGNQRTAYRPENLEIVPCNTQNICEMSGSLEATRALVGLFPDPYLLADQSGLGQIEICYDNVRWVDRRSEPVRADDPFVANYYGRLSFDLVGRYSEGETETPIFGFNYVSPDEFHYLFAAATDEVLDDDCPVEWVGSRIETTLNSESPIRVVPDRLTYLAAARSLPSRIFRSNWDRNQEWRDAFVTGLGVQEYEIETDDQIIDRVNQHLQSLYQAGQSELYTALMQPPSREGWLRQESLFSRMQELTARKALVRTYIKLFYPQLLVDSDEIRGLLEGYDALLDGPMLRRFRQSQVAISSVNEQGRVRIENMVNEWNRQPVTVRRSGSVATSVAHAMIRLDSIYDLFFAQPQNPTQVVPSGLAQHTTVRTGDQGG